MSLLADIWLSLPLLLALATLAFSDADLRDCLLRNKRIRLPHWYEALTIQEFKEKVADQKLYGFYTGDPDSRLGRVLTKTELIYSINEEETIASFRIKGNLQNGSCVYETNRDIFDANSFQLKSSKRMIFGNENDYIAMVSSNPDQYIVLFACIDAGFNRRSCRTIDTFVVLYTKMNPPSNLNLELAARDIRQLTCLSMDGIPGVYNFVFVQGESECPDLPAEER